MIKKQPLSQKQYFKAIQNCKKKQKKKEAK